MISKWIRSLLFTKFNKGNFCDTMIMQQQYETEEYAKQIISMFIRW